MGKMKKILYPLFCILLRQVNSLSPLCPLPPYDDDVHLNCETENGDFSSLQNSIDLKNIFKEDEPIELNIIEYNIDRNGYGGDGTNESGLDPIISLLQNSNLIPIPDIITLSEVGRGCESYGGQNISGALEIAKAFGFYYTYAVEYVVVSESDDVNECSIGNALLSRYPIQNIQQLRFETQCCRYGKLPPPFLFLLQTILNYIFTQHDYFTVSLFFCLSALNKKTSLLLL